MLRSTIVESRTARDGNAGFSSDAMNAPIDMMIFRRFRRQTCRHEIRKFGNSIGQQEAGYQDIGGRPIKLFVANSLCLRRNLEAPAFFIIEYCAKNAGRIE